MSKWSIYQLITVLFLGSIIVIMNTPPKAVSTLFTIIDEKVIPETIFVIFCTVIIGVWLIAFLFYCEEMKGKTLFRGKVWRIMPAIVGVSLVVTFFIFIALGLTILTDITAANRWLLHIIVISFLLQIYLFILSLYVRYNEQKTNRQKVISAANATVILLLVVLFFIPAL
ncbi:MAG TPA: hypothetical protein VK135_05520 [Candidatus Dormibacteraeota bacterium]|nr:hypothetical protein [Candidatus Dormibacteraeota bacterium]